MADHRAEVILNKIKEIVTGLTTTGQNVDRGRGEEIPAEKTPALRVFMGPDVITDPWSGNLLDSEIDVGIEATVHDSATNVETLLNKIRAEVNVALVADYQIALPNIVHAIVELGASRPSISGELSKPSASMELRYRVKYRRSRTDPTT